MTRLMRALGIGIVVFSFLGCAGMTPREQRTVSGGAAGAAGGAALGAITGGSPAIGAGVGGAAGALGGFILEELERRR